MSAMKSFAQLDFERLDHFKKRGFSPNCIFDVGASNGGWTQKISPLFPEAKFFLFEPLLSIEPDYDHQLDNYLNENPDWKVYKCALGNFNGTVPIYRSKISSFGSTTVNVNYFEDYCVCDVPQSTLDSIIDPPAGVPVPDLIKMDIQGGELDALRGCENNLSKVQLLLLETWFSRVYGNNTPLVHEVINYLVPFEFYLFEISDYWRDEKGNLISPDLFFVNKDSPLARDYSFA